jgi:hypothetical protein
MGAHLTPQPSTATASPFQYGALEKFAESAAVFIIKILNYDELSEVTKQVSDWRPPAGAPLAIHTIGWPEIPGWRAVSKPARRYIASRDGYKAYHSFVKYTTSTSPAWPTPTRSATSPPGRRGGPTRSACRARGR